MTMFYDEPFTREELLQRVGDVSQLGGVELSELLEGKERGVRILNFRTGRLNFTSVVERAMDITRVEYCGQPLAWLSPVGVTAPWFYNDKPLDFLRSFFGGLITTCGMTHTLWPEEDTTEQYYYPAKPTEHYPLHGRVTNMPAKLVSHGGKWEGNDYVMWAEGKILEASVYGENLCLTRRIETRLGASTLRVHDEVENIGWYETPHMYLYHINLGFPVIDEGAEIIVPTASVIAANEAARPDLDKWNICTGPIKNNYEQIYAHDLVPDETGTVLAGIVNRKHNGGQGLGVYLRYSKQALPYFWNWKMMGQGTYTVALEPSTNSIEGRLKDREAGRLTYLKPGEKRNYDLEIGVLGGQDEIRAFESRVRKAAKA